MRKCFTKDPLCHLPTDLSKRSREDSVDSLDTYRRQDSDDTPLTEPTNSTWSEVDDHIIIAGIYDNADQNNIMYSSNKMKGLIDPREFLQQQQTTKRQRTIRVEPSEIVHIPEVPKLDRILGYLDSDKKSNSNYGQKDIEEMNDEKIILSTVSRSSLL